MVLAYSHRPLRWIVISVLLLPAGTGAAITHSGTAAHQRSRQPAGKASLESRVVQLEKLCEAAKPQGDRDQKTSQFLVQFYTAEYSAIMSRILSWASLQYALFPILVATFAMLVKMDNVDSNLRWWAAIGALLVGYLAYQGTMLDTLQNVLFVEQYLRPLASRVVGADQFWIHECIYRRTQIPNIFYWKYLPPLICITAMGGGDPIP